MGRDLRDLKEPEGPGGRKACWPILPLWPGSSLLDMGAKRSLQSRGTLLGFLTNILTDLSTATNYWIRYTGGHSGRWQECNGGICSNVPCQSRLAVTGASMVPAAGFGVVGLVMALRILYHERYLLSTEAQGSRFGRDALEAPAPVPRPSGSSIP
ncbi:Claudin Domain-Containing Protein 2 [Manis pentadactyla]|nr:Claudin Domain-Containing Protein 2 [Manis pentadactyla]